MVANLIDPLKKEPAIIGSPFSERSHDNALDLWV